jgi:hypothetical protein
MSAFLSAFDFSSLPSEALAELAKLAQEQAVAKKREERAAAEKLAREEEEKREKQRRAQEAVMKAKERTRPCKQAARVEDSEEEDETRLSGLEVVEAPASPKRVRRALPGEVKPVIKGV